MVTLVVDSRVHFPREAIKPDELRKLCEAFTHDNPDFARWEALPSHLRRGQEPEEFVRTYRIEKGRASFPRGQVGKVRKLLDSFGHRTEVEDRRVLGKGPKPEGIAFDSKIELWDYQNEMVDAAIEAESGVLRGPTGCGKTIVGEAIALATGLPTLIVVPTEEIFKQWLRRLREELGMHERDIGIVRGPKLRIGPITVAMVQTLAKKAHLVADDFGAVIFDEVQRAAAKTFYQAIDGLPAKYRIGISADERRKDRKEFLVYDVFGEVAHEVSKERVESTGAVYDVEARLIPTAFRADWYANLPGEEKQAPEYFDRLLREMGADEDRRTLAIELALRLAREGHTVLAFSHRIEHCVRVQAAIAEREPRVGLLVGEGSKQEKDDALRGLVNGSVLVGVGTYQAIGAGVDIPAADRGICMTPIHTNRPFFGQVRGRICRKDRRPSATKKDAILYYLWDEKVYNLSPLRALLRFNAGNVKVLDGDGWADGREYLKRKEREQEERDSPDLFDGLFGRGSRR